MSIQTRRLSQKIVVADLAGFAALKKVDDYDPKNTDFTVDKGQAAADGHRTATETEAQTAAGHGKVHDATTAAQWAMHNFMLGAKEQIIAQFGPDSDEVAAVGLKKKSEYKKPRRKTKTPPKV